ncbi:MAG: YicC/YloC family endoribonuclease [Gammaproteobacteria bacterium]
MTGFARAEKRGPLGVLAWELRTVNHRYLDISLRLPENLRALESGCREHIAQALRRGKLDAQLHFEAPVGEDAGLSIDEAYARAVVAAADHVAGLSVTHEAINPLDLLRWPGVVKQPQMDIEAVSVDALALLDVTLKTLCDMRAREGERIAALIRERSQAVGGIVSRIRTQAADIGAQLRSKLLVRFEELKLKLDETRLEQELVLMLQRVDVSEELDRLDSHMTELETTLGKEQAAGRRLDFLMQEFNREANTLGSKCQDTAITREVIELKVLIEQMREQIQNIE